MEFFIRMNGKIKKVDILYTEKLDILKALIHPIRLKILNALLKKPNYPKALAKELNIQPQKLLYHFKKLEELGLVEKIKEERISGSVARFYKVSPKLFVFNFLGDSIFETAIEIPINTPIISGWVAHFVQDSKLNAKIVVGSPDLHGPFSARARDAWSAAELSLYLGRFITTLDKNPIVLDTAVDADIIKENLILIGGPITNSITWKVNRYLPLYFDIESGNTIIDKVEMKRYTDDNLGIVALIDNPFVEEEKRKILVCAGKKIAGTRAAILSLIRYGERFPHNSNFAFLVEGIDKDSDGIIDDVTFVKELRL